MSSQQDCAISPSRAQIVAASSFFYNAEAGCASSPRAMQSIRTIGPWYPSLAGFGALAATQHASCGKPARPATASRTKTAGNLRCKTRGVVSHQASSTGFSVHPSQDLLKHRMLEKIPSTAKQQNNTVRDHTQSRSPDIEETLKPQNPFWAGL